MAEDTPGPNTPASPAPLSAGAVAEVYLGNILYAIERCAMSLDGEEKPVDAAFYRAIGRKLADAHRADAHRADAHRADVLRADALRTAGQ